MTRTQGIIWWAARIVGVTAAVLCGIAIVGVSAIGLSYHPDHAVRYYVAGAAMLACVIAAIVMLMWPPTKKPFAFRVSAGAYGVALAVLGVVLTLRDMGDWAVYISLPVLGLCLLTYAAFNRRNGESHG